MKLRTQEELANYTRKLFTENEGLESLCGANDLLQYLDYEYAKEFLTEDENQESNTVDLPIGQLIDCNKPTPLMTKSTWEEIKTDYTIENIIKEITDYLPFAFTKAEDGRGISANRSICHFKNWLFALGDDELYNFADDEDNYPEYGFPILKAIKEKYVK